MILYLINAIILLSSVLCDKSPNLYEILLTDFINRSHIGTVYLLANKDIAVPKKIGNHNILKDTLALRLAKNQRHLYILKVLPYISNKNIYTITVIGYVFRNEYGKASLQKEASYNYVYIFRKNDFSLVSYKVNSF